MLFPVRFHQTAAAPMSVASPASSIDAEHALVGAATARSVGVPPVCRGLQTEGNGFETSMHPLPPDVDLNEARARELEAIGYTKYAAQVRQCGTKIGWRVVRCHLRVCPLCSEDLREERAKQLAKLVRRMQAPMLGLFALPCPRADHLATEIEVFRKALAEVRRLQCFRSAVRGAVGRIEPQLFRDGLYLHAHVIIDLSEEVDDPSDVEDDFHHAFALQTGGRGQFSWDSQEVERDQALRLTRYVTKTLHWSPPPGAISPVQLGILIEGLRGRQLEIRWGWCSSRRRPQPTAMTVTCAYAAADAHVSTEMCGAEIGALTNDTMKEAPCAFE